MANTNPFISVIIPTYNRTNSILPTLESVKSQTFADLECLVIDDGSVDADALLEVVSSLKDERFRYVYQQNAGASRARNNGFDLARGDYIALLDSDDLFVPNKLETVVRHLCGQTGDVLLYSKMIVERGLEKKWLRPSRGIRASERVDEYLLCTSGTIRTSTVVVSAQLARNIRFDESLPSLQDTDFAIRVAHAGASIAFIDEPLVIFNDKVGGNRVSRNSDYKPLLSWLERMRDYGISNRAYWAGRGWQCARIASYSNRPYAIGLYFQSAIRGAFPLRQAVVIAAQVVLPYRWYQAAADMIVRLFGRHIAM